MIRRPILSLPEFFAHAIAIEREAALRYRDFERHLRSQGNDALAALCGNLARHEEQHLAEILAKSRGIAIPDIDASQYAWLEGGPPESAPPELLQSATDPDELLLLALRGEAGAQFFFAWVARTSPDARVRELARDMRAEEAQHVRWIEQALGYRPAAAKA